MNSDLPITSREFTREMGNVHASLSRIEDHLEKLNSKTATNTEDVRVLQRDVQALVSEDLAIDAKVTKLARDGCANYETHTRMLEQLGGITVWPTQKKAAVIGGLVGTGALIWPALQQIAAAVHALLERLPQ